MRTPAWPDGDDMEFARLEDGAVHVIAHPGQTRPADGLFLQRYQFRCGRWRAVWSLEPSRSIATRTTEFDDSEFCIPCIRSLGEDSWRAFNRESDEPDAGANLASCTG
jgi:hypothetical protein